MSLVTFTVFTGCFAFFFVFVLFCLLYVSVRSYGPMCLRQITMYVYVCMYVYWGSRTQNGVRLERPGEMSDRWRSEYFIGTIVVNVFWIMWSWVHSRKYGVYKTCHLCFLRLRPPFCFFSATPGFRGTCCHIVGEIWLGPEWNSWFFRSRNRLRDCSSNLLVRRENCLLNRARNTRSARRSAAILQPNASSCASSWSIPIYSCPFRHRLAQNILIYTPVAPMFYPLQKVTSLLRINGIIIRWHSGKLSLTLQRGVQLQAVV